MSSFGGKERQEHKALSQAHTHHVQPGPRAKCDSVVWECIVKTAEIVVQSRSVVDRTKAEVQIDDITQSSRFNLEIEPIPSVRKALLPWKQALHVPIRLDVFYHFFSFEKHCEERILLERWCLDYRYHHPQGSSNTIPANQNMISELRQVVKKIVILLRTLHCHARLLPAYSIHCYLTQDIPLLHQPRGGLQPKINKKKSQVLGRGGVTGPNGKLFVEGNSNEEMASDRDHQNPVPRDSKQPFIGYAFHTSVNPTDHLTQDPYLTRNNFEQHAFRPIVTPYGTLHIRVWYHPQSKSIATNQMHQQNATVRNSTITAPIAIIQKKPIAVSAKNQPSKSLSHPRSGSADVNEFLIQDYSPTPESLLLQKRMQAGGGLQGNSRKTTSISEGLSSEEVGSIRPSMSGLSLALMHQSDQQSTTSNLRHHRSFSASPHTIPVGDESFTGPMSLSPTNKLIARKDRAMSERFTITTESKHQFSPSPLNDEVGARRRQSDNVSAAREISSTGQGHGYGYGYNTGTVSERVNNFSSNPWLMPEQKAAVVSTSDVGLNRRNQVPVSSNRSHSPRHLSSSPAPFVVPELSSTPPTSGNFLSTSIKQRSPNSYSRSESVTNSPNPATFLYGGGKEPARPPSPPFCSFEYQMKRASQGSGVAPTNRNNNQGQDSRLQDQLLDGQPQGSLLLPYKSLETLHASPFKTGPHIGDTAKVGPGSKMNQLLAISQNPVLWSSLSAMTAPPLIPGMRGPNQQEVSAFLLPPQHHSLFLTETAGHNTVGRAPNSLLGSGGAFYTPFGAAASDLNSNMSSLSLNTGASGVPGGSSTMFGASSHAATSAGAAWDEMPFASVADNLPSNNNTDDAVEEDLTAAATSFAQQFAMANRLSCFDDHKHKLLDGEFAELATGSLKKSLSSSHRSSHDINMEQLAEFKSFASTLQVPP